MSEYITYLGPMQSALYPFSFSVPTVAYFPVAELTKGISELSPKSLKSCIPKFTTEAKHKQKIVKTE